MNPIAEILVANGQGLIAVISPSINAETTEYCEFSSIFFKNSIQLE
jgi:hypothetical protein